MKYYTWDEEKNKKLIEERKVSFEEVVFFIEKGNLLDVLDHPNKQKYKNQRMFVVRIGDYAYLVPFVEGKKDVFLKTIIPSRKATKEYLSEVKNDE
ncbi:MAG: BrnT family toxin [Candidatus Omnitrophica bacterium]|nr:BrnT family toxin [Candidatus Omnitrophota bacterium]